MSGGQPRLHSASPRNPVTSTVRDALGRNLQIIEGGETIVDVDAFRFGTASPAVQHRGSIVERFFFDAFGRATGAERAERGLTARDFVRLDDGDRAIEEVRTIGENVYRVQRSFDDRGRRTRLEVGERFGSESAPDWLDDEVWRVDAYDGANRPTSAYLGVRSEPLRLGIDLCPRPYVSRESPDGRAPLHLGRSMDRRSQLRERRRAGGRRRGPRGGPEAIPRRSGRASGRWSRAMVDA